MRPVVARRQHERIVPARLPGVVAQRDGFTRRLGAAADDQWQGAEAGVGEGLAGGAGDEGAFRGGEVDGFAVGALGCEAGDAGAGEPDGVAGDGG